MTAVNAVAGERLRVVLAERSLILEGELGRGGMSIVYLARDLRNNRRVAVKVLRPGVPAGAERFVREITTIAPLVHPNIVPLFDSGIADGVPYFVMPYIEGESLRQRLQSESHVPVADAIRIAAEIAEALTFAHGHGILHRDIKPENILLQAGHAVVTDFGVARALSESDAAATPGANLTGQGLVLGTPEYMSPEQASADPAVDGRTDIYSLGCVFYEMLAGVAPFSGGSPRETMALRFRGSPLPLRELRPEISAHLEMVIRKAMDPDPAQRFASAADFLAALRSPDNETMAGQSNPRRRRRVRWATGLIGTSALLALGIQDVERPRLDPHRVVVALPSNETGDSSLSYLGHLTADRLTAALAGAPGLTVVTSATTMPSRLTRGIQDDSLDDPLRLRLLAQETAAGTVVSGSYFRSGQRIFVQAEITDANGGAMVGAVGPVSAPVARVGDAVDSLGRSLESALQQRLRDQPRPKSE